MINRAKISIKTIVFVALLIIVTASSINAQQNKPMENLKTSGYALVNGLKMYYEIYGEGDMPLVLIHGGGSTIESSFGKILPFFAGYGKVIALELQAHGRTNDRNAPESFEQDADDVAGLLNYLKIGKANFFGFSNGGTTTLQIAIRHPEIVNKIVDLAGACKKDGFFPGFFDGFKNATLDKMPEPLQAAFLKVTPDKNGLQNMFERDVARMVNFKDIPDDVLQSIKAKALIMVNDQDVMPCEHAVKMTHLIPGARLMILPGYHGACIGEVCAPNQDSKQPEATTMLINEFLKD
jgi:pimeloyl-ACP methyl ester carboxylesterase